MNDFIKKQIEKLSKDIIEVSVSNNFYNINEIKDTFGKIIFNGETESLGRLIFIDYCTLANWSHPCGYIFYVNDNEYYMSSSEGWMPDSSIVLITIDINKL